MPQIGANFQFTSRQPNFERDQFDTIAHMAACTVCDEGHKCYCLENQKTYEFTSVDSNGDAIEPNETTGYWHEFTSGGTGDVTGATIGSGASEQNVTKVGSILKFPAYPSVPVKGIKDSNGNDIAPDANGKVILPASPSVPITKIKVDGESNDLPINDGRVVIPQPPVKGIKTNSGSDLTPDLNGKVTLPPIPADQSTRIKKIEDSIAQMGNNQPIVIPPSAVELPVSTSNPDYIDYDSDTTYVMNIDGTQVATIHYPYVDNSNNYVAFKAIDRDLYYAYIVSVVNDAERYTYSNQYTWSTLPADAKSKFESGIYAIKQVINDDGTLPEKKWYKNIPSVFVDKNNLPLRTRRIDETISSSVIDVLLVKNDRLNKIYRYAFNGISNAWVLINGGCYTKDDPTTGENYIKYDAYFDRQSASNVSFDDTIPQLGTENDPVTNIQDAINQLATGIRGFTGKLIVRLLYANSSPITNKEVSITVNWRGESYDISSMYSPDTQGFKTDSNGYVIDAANHEFLVLPLGATYTIHFYDISVNYITPEDKTGIIDANSKTINCVYDNASDNEMVYVYVQMPNVSPSIATTNNKILYVYYYDNNNISYLQYVCLLRANGTIKQILEADGTTQATFNGNNLISDSDPVLIPIPIGNKYTCALQEWDESIPSTQQEYVKSTDQTFIASKIKRTVTFKYINVQLGIFLIIEDNTKSIGYRECIVTNQDTENNRITFKDGESTYYAYLNNSSLYKDLVGSNTPILWEENIIGYGIRTSILVSSDNNDIDTYNMYPNCCFFVPKNIQFQAGQMLSNDSNIILDSEDKGGLYLTKSLAAINADQNSPVCQALINSNSKAITLNLPNQNTRIIQGFVPTRYQIAALRSNYNIINTIHQILTGSNYYKSTGTTSNRIWTSSLASSANKMFYIFENSSTFGTPNPTTFNGTSTAFAAFICYPF